MPTDFTRIKELFLAVLEMPTADRAAYLDKVLRNIVNWEFVASNLDGNGASRADQPGVRESEIVLARCLAGAARLFRFQLSICWSGSATACRCAPPRLRIEDRVKPPRAA